MLKEAVMTMSMIGQGLLLFDEERTKNDNWIQWHFLHMRRD